MAPVAKPKVGDVVQCICSDACGLFGKVVQLHLKVVTVEVIRATTMSYGSAVGGTDSVLLSNIRILPVAEAVGYLLE